MLKKFMIGTLIGFALAAVVTAARADPTLDTYLDCVEGNYASTMEFPVSKQRAFMRKAWKQAMEDCRMERQHAQYAGQDTDKALEAIVPTPLR